MEFSHVIPIFQMVLTLSGFLMFLIGSTKPSIWSCSLSTR